MKRLWSCVAVLLLAACGPLEQPAQPGAQEAAKADLALGRKVYNFRCYYCHGYSGDGKTLAASFIDPAPRDFTAADAKQLTRERMIAAVSNGRAETAMTAFAGTLTGREIAAVVDFIADEFISKRAANTRYHTAANGWPDHERYGSAFPFARGEVAIDTPNEELDEEQRAGRRLFMSACITCHDRARVNDQGATWELRSVSYPPNTDACVGCHRYATALHGRAAPPSGREAGPPGPYDLHDTPPGLVNATSLELRGEALFQRNCTFCHAADGTGRNWIGAFLEPHPRNLGASEFHKGGTSRARLAAAIRTGVPGTSMPAWEGVLAPNDIEAIAAYVSKAFGAR